MSQSIAAPVGLIEVHEDPEVLDRLAEQLDELHAVTGTPVTARRVWLQTWLATHDEWSVLAVTVHRDEQLVAAAILVRRPGRLLERVRPAGTGASDEVRLPARDGLAAQELAAGIVGALVGLGRPWHLALQDAPPGDPVVTRLAELLKHAAIAPGDVSPRLTLGPAREFRAYVSRHHHRQSRWLHNRLTRDGHKVEIDQVNDPASIAAVLPEVVAVCRARDHELRRYSCLDGGAGLGFFRDVVTAHAARDEVELTTLRVDGALAAYDLCFKDGATWRLWNCRFDPRWAAYGLGRLSHEASISAALAQGSEMYDWMRGDEPYKQALSDHIYRVADLFAASNAVLWSAFESARRTRSALRDAKNSQPAASRAWERLRPVMRAVRHPALTRSADV